MTDFSLKELLFNFKKQLWKICVGAAAAAIAAFIFCSYIAIPTYQSKVSILCSNGGIGTDTEDSVAISGANISASLLLINTYVGILQNGTIYEMTADKCGLDYTASEIRSMVSIAPRSSDALFIDISVTTSNRDHAVVIANTFLSLTKDYIIERMPNAYVEPLDKMAKSASKNYPKTSQTVLLSALGGAVFVFALILLLSHLDKNINTKIDFEKQYGIPLLGAVPNYNIGDKE